MEKDQWINVLITQMQERNHAWHQMRARSMQFTLWILGLAVAASWHLLQDPCDGFYEKTAVTLLAVLLGGVSFYFLRALARGVRKNREALINVEAELGLHDEENAVLPDEYKKTESGWSAHFKSLYALLLLTLAYLLLAIWIAPQSPATNLSNEETATQEKTEVDHD